MTFRNLSILIAAAAVIQGCALTDASLSARAEQENLFAGPLSESTVQVFTVGELTDARADKDRVGYKKNGFGANMADIRMDKDVTDIVSMTLTDAVIANGHTLGDDGLMIRGRVNQFWVETDMNFWTIELLCNIETDLTFVNAATGDELYTATYRGGYSKHFQTALEGNYEKVVVGALESLVEDIVFDEDLLDALQENVTVAEVTAE